MILKKFKPFIAEKITNRLMDSGLKLIPSSSTSSALIADELNDCTTIVSAATKGHPACIDRLINEGGDVNAHCQNNYTALAIAA